MSNWEYGGIYKDLDMEGVITLPNDSKVKVCDLTKELPGFMLEADTLFIDPPCSTGNLRSFHTKADQLLPYTFSEFEESLFGRIMEIKPKYLFLEVFKSNKDAFLKHCKDIYQSVEIYNSFYYNSRSKPCWILHCTNETENRRYEALEDIDEAKAIAWLCKNHEYNCIGDLCMGRGLVGQNAYMNGKKFVGTELNKKRLAILVDFINKNPTRQFGRSKGRYEIKPDFDKPLEDFKEYE